MILNIYLRSGHAIRLDHVRNWKRSNIKVEWEQGPGYEVGLSYLDVEEVVAVTRENPEGDD